MDWELQRVVPELVVALLPLALPSEQVLVAVASWVALETGAGARYTEIGIVALGLDAAVETAGSSRPPIPIIVMIAPRNASLSPVRCSH